ncbi:MAG: hypothetical protein QM519_02315 [Bacteroidia bacterium]|nr:hypothetical protein [Bacteroidia bacterium]
MDRNGANPPEPAFGAGVLAGRYEMPVLDMRTDGAPRWWTVRLAPASDAFEGTETQGTQNPQFSGRALARITAGMDGTAAPIYCQWPVAGGAVFNVWASNVNITALPLQSAVIANIGDRGPRFIASVVEGQAQRSDSLWFWYANVTAPEGDDTIRGLLVPPYARRCRISGEASSPGGLVQVDTLSQGIAGTTVTREGTFSLGSGTLADPGFPHEFELHPLASQLVISVPAAPGALLQVGFEVRP